MLVSVLMISSMTAISIFLLNDMKDNMSEEFRERGMLLAREFSQKVAEGILIEDKGILDKFISQLCRSKDVLYVYVYGQSGLSLAQKVLFKGIENELPAKDKLDDIEIEELFFGEKKHNSILDIRTPVSYEEEHIGHIRLGISLERIHEKVNKRIVNSCILVFIFISIGLVMCFFFSRSFSKPISQLLEGVKKIGQGDLSHHVKVQKKDEIGELAEAFNKMGANLQKTTTSLDNLHREISERKRVQQKLRQSYEELKQTQNKLIQSGKLASIGELSAGVAHELNQPLMIIRATAQLMLRKQRKNALDTVKLPEDLNSIERNTKRMMNIINHLRTFSRQTQGQFMPVNVNNIIRDSFLMIGEQLSLRNIEVIQDFLGDLPKVLGDANQLEQVFLNLLTNARDALESKFEARGGGAELQKKIVITTHVSGDVKDMVEILFKDTGSGILQETLKNIFDPFYTTKEVGKGTGLGLSISYGIVKDHKGEIDVAETGPEGTTVRIRLPVAKSCLPKTPRE